MTVLVNLPDGDSRSFDADEFSTDGGYLTLQSAGRITAVFAPMRWTSAEKVCALRELDKLHAYHAPYLS